MYDFTYVASGQGFALPGADAEGGDADAADAIPEGGPELGGEHVDARPANCGDPGLTSYIYVVTQQGELLSFDPVAARFAFIGKLDCPDSRGTPFSMAVDRQGVAYVEYSSGALFRVSTRTADCTSTPFVAQGFTTFGMAFLDRGGPADTLYISTDGVPPPWSGESALATLDLTTFQVAVLGAMSLSLAELTGSPDGRLFAYYGVGASSAIAQVDPGSAKILTNTNLSDLPEGSAWAIGYWGGDFYIFTAPAGTSIVTRFRPGDGSFEQVATLNATVYGAGVSTCAPSF